MCVCGPAHRHWMMYSISDSGAGKITYFYFNSLAISSTDHQGMRFFDHRCGKSRTSTGWMKDGRTGKGPGNTRPFNGNTKIGRQILKLSKKRIKQDDEDDDEDDT